MKTNKNRSFHNYFLSDVFNGIDGISSKSMFGGYGFYKDGIIFAIIADEKLHFKVGSSNQKDYEDYGSAPFVYPMKNGKTTTLSFWELPADIMEDKEILPSWIEKSVQASLLSKKKK